MTLLQIVVTNRLNIIQPLLQLTNKSGHHLFSHISSKDVITYHVKSMHTGEIWAGSKNL